MPVESVVGKQIREVLATSLQRKPSSIKPEHSLRDDLGLDSLMTFELLYDLEKAFDLEIPNDDLPGLQTLDDVVKYVEERVNSSKVNPESPKKTLAKKPLRPRRKLLRPSPNPQCPQNPKQHQPRQSRGKSRLRPSYVPPVPQKSM